MHLETPIDHSAALDLFCKLVQIDAETGNEYALAQMVASVVKRLFPQAQVIYDHCNEQYPKGYASDCPGNLIISIPGTKDGPVVGLSAHLDRVKPGRGIKPVVQDDRVTSDGNTILAADDVAGIAVILAALQAIAERNLPHLPLQLIFTLSEEVKIMGARCLDTQLLRARQIFSFDGEEADLIYRGACASQKYTIRITGKLAHAGIEPEKGVSAPLIFALAVARLRKRGLFGACRGMNASVNLNVAGFREVGTNSVQDGLLVTGEARSFDNDELGHITSAVRRAFANAARAVKSSEGVAGQIDFETDMAYHAFELPADHPTVARAQAAIRKAGLEPKSIVVRGGLDASWLNRHGVPTIALGMGCRKPHTKGEYLLRREFEQACVVALHLALEE